MKLPIQERKKYVIILRKKRYTVRQIADELHMSTRDVNEILKEYKREENETREREVIEKEEKEKERFFSSKRSDALQLFKKGTNLLEVAIELDISAAEAKAFYSEYCSLQYSHQFLQIYMELNKTDSFNHFTDLFHLIREKGMSIEEGIEAIEMINDIFLLKKEHQDLSTKIAKLENTQDLLKADMSFFKVQNEEMEIRLNSTLEKIDVKEKTLDIIGNKVRQKEEEIYKMNSGENYYKARDRIKLLVEEFLGNRKNVIAFAVSAVFDAVKEIHQKEIPIKDLSKSLYGYVSDSSDGEVYRQKLQDVAEKVWDSISDACTS